MSGRRLNRSSIKHERIERGFITHGDWLSVLPRGYDRWGIQELRATANGLQWWCAGGENEAIEVEMRVLKVIIEELKACQS